MNSDKKRNVPEAGKVGKARASERGENGDDGGLHLG